MDADYARDRALDNIERLIPFPRQRSKMIKQIRRASGRNSQPSVRSHPRDAIAIYVRTAAQRERVASSVDGNSFGSALDFASAKLFECDFSIKLPAILGAGFSSVLCTPSRQLSVWPFLYETAIDDKIFARHPPCRESFLKALPNSAAREPR